MQNADRTSMPAAAPAAARPHAAPGFLYSAVRVFDLSLDAYERLLPEYAREVETGAGTGERNFLPFVAWLSARADVITVPCTDPEEPVGVNTPDELHRVERNLRHAVSDV